MKKIVRSTAMINKDFVGLWKRLVLDADGLSDTTTTVFYLQTKSGLFADIRIPVDWPRSLANFSRATNEELLALSRAKGFGGTFHADMATAVCRWDRELDFQPRSPPEQYLPDESNFSISGRFLIETGIHEVFREDWERITEDDTPTSSFRLSDACGGRRGILVTAGNYFIAILNRESGDLPESTSLEALVSSDISKELRIEAVNKLSMPIVFGLVDGSKAASNTETQTSGGRWLVLQSLYPHLVGTCYSPISECEWSLVHSDLAATALQDLAQDLRLV